MCAVITSCPHSNDGLCACSLTDAEWYCCLQHWPITFSRLTEAGWGGGAEALQGNSFPLGVWNVRRAFSESPLELAACSGYSLEGMANWSRPPFSKAGREVETGISRNPEDPETWSGAIMYPSIHALEVSGVLLSAGAWLCSLATTLMSTWLTLSTDLLPTESYELGLWETCVVQDLGTLECRPFDSLLGLPPDIKLARILMCVTLAAGLLGLLLAIPGMHVVNSCHDSLEDIRCKRGMKMAGAVLCLVAGVLGLIPVSYIAHLAVIRFFDETLPEMVPRWEFGDALFCGWTAGVLHLVAGALLLTSCFCLQRENCNTPVPIPLVRVNLGQPPMRTRSVYVWFDVPSETLHVVTLSQPQRCEGMKLQQSHPHKASDC